MPIIPRDAPTRPKLVAGGPTPTIRHLAAIYKSAWTDRGLAPRYFTQQELFMNRGLLAQMTSIDELKEIVQTYVQLDDPWYKNNGHPLGLLMRAHPMIMAVLEKRKAERRAAERTDFGGQELETA